MWETVLSFTTNLFKNILVNDTHLFVSLTKNVVHEGAEHSRHFHVWEKLPQVYGKHKML